jgi:dTDP-4-amino-4,6-dideoxygalactose transaminase
MKRLYARHRIDLRPADLAAGFAAMAATDPDRAASDAEQLWAPDGSALACYSVRSGFHLLLTSLGLPSGSEVLFSAVTHPDMPRIAEHHGLRVLPIDLDLDTLAPRPELVLHALTPETRMLVVAHLFGGRVDLAPLAEICRRHGVLLVEDCAQALRGPDDTGDPLAIVSMFSFGLLKTATALGGAMLRIRDQRLLDLMRFNQAQWRVQKRAAHLRRLVQAAAFVTVTRPVPYGTVVGLATAAGMDFDRFVNASVRAFPAGSTDELVERLELRPGAPLLRLLEHRLRNFDEERLAARASSGESLAEMLPRGAHIGGASLDRTHWLFPVVSSRPDEVIRMSRSLGFDVARKASSVFAIAAPADRPDLEPRDAREAMSRLVFLPAYPELPVCSLEQLAFAMEGEKSHAHASR